ncbi:MAG: FKBP-type peptidyl-prolyl cis-trans isomerase SlyD [Pseudomonadota bacterium]|jgi:FKBP-type peptidyl-prolyl cis-trans isomerase SlyD|nr:FKBP-type peptidyl-prolyl cis-trans isomerase SlyD [Pseudomonadota bacterium]MDQ5882039.1 FKBP-type peptidyl-prolyl cis-trans isomerase SlyD [Pseudomonadota bacterium]MDQ5916498.1 FKBP-type peptidyl-prolyl cis-trans isomerase SlyD [Pseudomonadota bacterium]MDQ5945339.1 FKBP-type peptidyl-prolyl cis-trans isomerase SlyD [Pseudomonadota bacterium]
MNTQVAKNFVVTLDYNVTDSDGELVDAGKEPLIYLHGGYDDIFPKIEEAVQGKAIGESIKVKLQPDEAFGEYDEELVQIESRDSLPKELQVGMQFEGAPEGADDEEFIIYRVTDIAEDKVVLDGNHPLAGMSLIFTCTVTAVRPASAEEITHGHVHGDDGDGGHCH